MDILHFLIKISKIYLQKSLNRVSYEHDKESEDRNMLSAGEKINVILKRKNINKGELAEKIGSSRQNLSNKFKRDNFSEKELLQIAEALDVELEIRFIDKESGELII